MSKTKIFFRADGNAKIGIGHVVRSLALADMLKEEFDCHFIIQNPLPKLKEQISEICNSIIELNPVIDYEKEAATIANTILKGNEIVVLDGYNFKTNYQKILKEKGCKIFCIDDIYSCHFVADVIINHAGGLTPAHYSAEEYTRFFLGLSYALLRKPFRDAAQKKVENLDSTNDVFICMGGADPNNDTINVLRKCEAITNIGTCFLVIGAAYQYEKELQAFIAQSFLKIEILSNLDADQMARYMEKCRIAITPPSTVSYEYLSTRGLLYLKVIADNQKNINRYFLEEGLAFDFDQDFDVLLEPSSEKKMALEKQQLIFDGNQQKRFLSLFKYYTLNYREANTQDCRLYFDWANDPASRKQSFNSDPIPFENHQKWFENRLKSPTSKLYIITKEEDSIGQVRFDIKNEEATISYSLDKKFRGNGFGSLILKKGVEVLKQELKERIIIIGFVKSNNIASAKAFEKLNFKKEKAKEFEDSFKYTLV